MWKPLSLLSGWAWETKCSVAFFQVGSIFIIPIIHTLQLFIYEEHHSVLLLSGIFSLWSLAGVPFSADQSLRKVTVTSRNQYNYETWIQWWVNVVPASATLALHWPIIESVSRVCWLYACFDGSSSPAPYTQAQCLPEKNPPQQGADWSCNGRHGNMLSASRSGRVCVANIIFRGGGGRAVKKTAWRLLPRFIKLSRPTGPPMPRRGATRRIWKQTNLKTIMPCKAKRQYLLTLQLSRYWIWPFQSRIRANPTYLKGLSAQRWLSASRHNILLDTDNPPSQKMSQCQIRR